MIFPDPSVPGERTRLVLDEDGNLLPLARWVGWVADNVGAAGAAPGTPLLVEQARGTFARPGLRGHRLADPGGADPRDVGGRDWSPLFRTVSTAVDGELLGIDAVAEQAGLALRTEIETLTGGALRIRHRLRNTGTAAYLLQGLDVTVPVPDVHSEMLDFTGRHELERSPQRAAIRDGLWLREGRQGRPGLDSATMLVTGTEGFGFAHGDCLAVHVAWSGNSALRLERGGASGTTLGGGELLLPGELVLLAGESYTSPWLFVVASTSGLDGLAEQLHTWQRTLSAHPRHQPVTLNVWEAVYFDHDLSRLTQLAELGAQVGVERFVLDDGWFHGRRDDTSGLGDWWIDEQIWPQGLDPLISKVRGLGMEFGLWFEPEMVNPDSELYRAHPDWVLATDRRVPRLHRSQLVLDLTNPEAWTTVHDRMVAILAAHDIDYVKWDHNRELLEAGSSMHGGAPAAHEQTFAFYRLLDALRERFPRIDWESCASGGGRIDLGVVERVERFWTSDMTDALARQQIQRWSVQLAAPEYLGAHISAPTAHQSGRTFSLDFRAATALFGSFGIEWDLTAASEAQLVELSQWVSRHKHYRPLLHSGRTVRIDVADPAVLAHGIVAGDGSAGLIVHVQLTESTSNRGVSLRVPGLDSTARYRLSWAAPIDPSQASMAGGLDLAGPTSGAAMTGAALARVGVWMPRRRAETIGLIDIVRVD